MCKYMVYSRKSMQSQIAALSLGWYLVFLGRSKYSAGERAVHVFNCECQTGQENNGHQKRAVEV